MSVAHTYTQNTTAMTGNTRTQLPDNPADAVGLVIQLRYNAPDSVVERYGRGEYVVGISKANADIPGITTEELLRIFPIDQYPDGQVHSLLFGRGMYIRMCNRFVVVRRLTPEP